MKILVACKDTYNTVKFDELTDFVEKVQPIDYYECGYICQRMNIYIIDNEGRRISGFYEYEKDFKLELRNSLKYMYLSKEIDLERACFEYISQFRFFRNTLLGFTKEDEQENYYLEEEILSYLQNDDAQIRKYFLKSKNTKRFE